MHLLFSLLAPLATIFAPLLNTAPPVQAGPAYAIAAVRAAKPIACGTNFSCFLKAAAACKSASVNHTLKQKSDDLTASFARRMILSGAKDGTCNFELTMTGVRIAFSPKNIAYIKSEAKKYGQNPAAAVKAELDRNTRDLNADIKGKFMRCKLTPAQLVPLLKQIRDGKETDPAPEDLGCTGTMLEQASKTIDLSDDVAPAGGTSQPSAITQGTQSTDACAALKTASGDFVYTPDDLKQFVKDPLNAPEWTSSPDNPNATYCGYKINVRKFGTDWSAMEIESGPSIFNIYKKERARGDADVRYEDIANLGDEAFMRFNLNGIEQPTLFIRSGEKRVDLTCFECDKKRNQLITIGRTIISRWAR